MHSHIYSIFNKWINYFIIDYKIILKAIVNVRRAVQNDCE